MCKEEPTEKDETYLIVSCDEFTDAYYKLKRGIKQPAKIQWPNLNNGEILKLPSRESDERNFSQETREFKYNLANQILTIAVVENIDKKRAENAI